jgi:hypothetical protein
MYTALPVAENPFYSVLRSLAVVSPHVTCPLVSIAKIFDVTASASRVVHVSLE